MNDRPCKRKEDDAPAFEFEYVKTADTFSVLCDKAGKHYLRADLDELIVLAVHDAEHQTGDAAVRRNYCNVTEDDLRDRPRKTREYHAGDKGVCNEAVIRFDRYKQVRHDAHRMNRPVADGRKCLHAKEESAHEQVSGRRARRIDQRFCAKRRVQSAECDVAEKIEQQQQAQEIAPRH